MCSRRSPCTLEGQQQEMRLISQPQLPAETQQGASERGGTTPNLQEPPALAAAGATEDSPVS